jgi:hypothetical protein
MIKLRNVLGSGEKDVVVLGLTRILVAFHESPISQQHSSTTGGITSFQHKGNQNQRLLIS